LIRYSSSNIKLNGDKFSKKKHNWFCRIDDYTFARHIEAGKA